MKSNIKAIFMSLLIFGASLAANGQGNISGPECVRPGVEYQYLINFKGKFNNKSEVCITGGSLVGSKTDCTSIDTFAAIKVIWDEKSVRGTIAFTSSKGNAGFDVNIIEELKPGSVTARKSQVINYDASREQIICSPATGGSCSPAYDYQWESSEDAVAWKEVKSGNAINLSNPEAQKRPMFYRRRVTEKTSGLVAYSDIASVYLNSISF